MRIHEEIIRQKRGLFEGCEGAKIYDTDEEELILIENNLASFYAALRKVPLAYETDKKYSRNIRDMSQRNKRAE